MNRELTPIISHCVAGNEKDFKMWIPVRRPGLGLLQSAESHEGKKNRGSN